MGGTGGGGVLTRVQRLGAVRSKTFGVFWRDVLYLLEVRPKKTFSLYSDKHSSFECHVGRS